MIGVHTRRNLTEYYSDILIFFLSKIFSSAHHVPEVVFHRRGSKEHHGFWPFFYRYQKFQSKNKSERVCSEGEGRVTRLCSPRSSRTFTTTLGNDRKSKVTGRFGLPTQYDKSYRINFVIKPPLRSNAKEKGMFN